MTSPNPPKKCKHEGCTKAYANNAYGQAAAYREGWFMSRKGEAWCSEHVPDWVKEWRDRLKKTSGF